MGIPTPTYGYHSITFIDNITNIVNATDEGSMYRHTYDNWHMVPVKRPSVAPPTVKTFSTDLLGSDGERDTTTVLSGRPLFGNRKDHLNF